MDHANLSSIFQRFWKPAAVTSAGGTAVAIWFEEIILYDEEILALIFLPILAGMIIVFNIYIFDSHMPHREDLQTTQNPGEKK